MPRRVLNRLKANRLRKGLGTPSSQEGINGEFTIRKTNSGEILYIRHNNRWNYVTKLQRVLESGKAKRLSTAESTARLALTDYLVIKNASGTMSLHSNKLTAITDFEIDTGGNQVLIDTNVIATEDSTNRGLLVDLDHTGISASGETVTNIGIQSYITSNSVTHIGSVNNTGISNVVLSGTDGTTIGWGIFNKVTGADTNLGIWSEVTDGGADIKMVSSANTADYCTIATTAEGATTIRTVDADTTVAHLTLQADGEVVLDSQTGNNAGLNIQFAGTSCARFEAHHSNTYFTMYENGGASIIDYFRIACAADGATIISTNDQAATAAHLTLKPDGKLICDATTGGLYLEEDASAGHTSATYGQIWVKNEAPNELYFTTDAGDDIQITDGTAIAGGGGSSKFVLASHSGRVNANNTARYYYGSTTYGWDYHAPASYVTTPTSMSYLYNYAGIIVPFTLTKIGLNISIRATSSNDMECYAYVGTPNYDSTTATTLTQRIELTQSSPTTNRAYNLSGTYTGAIAAGDIIVIYFRASGGSQYLYWTYNLWGEAA